MAWDPATDSCSDMDDVDLSWEFIIPEADLDPEFDLYSEDKELETPGTPATCIKIQQQPEEQYTRDPDVIGKDIMTTEHHIVVRNASSRHHHLRMLITAKYMLQVAASGRGYTFMVPGLARFMSDDTKTASLTINWTSDAWKTWIYLTPAIEFLPFTSAIQFHTFKPQKGLAVRLLLPENLPRYDNPDPLKPQPHWLWCKLNTFTTRVASLFSWQAVFALLKYLFLLWILCRAFLRDTIASIERSIIQAPASILATPPPAPAMPHPPPIIDTTLIPPSATISSGPQSLRDHIDYFLGWRGPKGD
jgi:hypothetical protein